MFDLLTGKDNFMLYISLRIHPRHDHEHVVECIWSDSCNVIIEFMSTTLLGFSSAKIELIWFLFAAKLDILSLFLPMSPSHGFLCRVSGDDEGECGRRGKGDAYSVE